MKILMLLYSPFRHDSRVLKEARTLSEAGHDVRLVAVRDATTPAQEFAEGFEVIRVDCDPLPTRALRWILARAHTRRDGAVEADPVGVDGEAARAAPPPPLVPLGRDGPALRLARRVHVFWSRLIFLRRVQRLARGAPADLYVAHDLETLPAAILAKRRLGGRVLYDSHELFVERRFTVPPQTRMWKPAWGLIERRLIREADQVVTVCQPIAVELGRRYAVPAPAVILNAPPRARPRRGRDLRARLGISAQTTVVLYLGGLLANRGIEETIQSLALLDGAALVLLGPTSPAYAQHLSETAELVGVGERVFLAGAVPPDDVVDWAHSADVGVCLIQNVGLSYYYSLPNKLFEYLAAGIPVVASDFPAMGDIVETTGAGVACDPRNPEAIATAIRWVTDDPVRHADLRSKAVMASERFCWEVEATKLETLVDQLRRA